MIDITEYNCCYNLTFIGAKKGGATFNFFKESEHPIYHSMFLYMDAHPDEMTATNDEGLDRVKNNDDYAFLMESSSIEYIAERHCTVTQIGDKLDDKGNCKKKMQK